MVTPSGSMSTIGATAATLLLTLVVSRISVPGSMDDTVVNAGNAQHSGEMALHDQAVALDGFDVCGAADQRHVVELRKLCAVGAADGAGAEDDDVHRPFILFGCGVHLLRS